MTSWDDCVSGAGARSCSFTIDLDILDAETNFVRGFLVHEHVQRLVVHVSAKVACNSLWEDLIV